LEVVKRFALAERKKRDDETRISPFQVASDIMFAGEIKTGYNKRYQR
jgi:hypothetical protein